MHFILFVYSPDASRLHLGFSAWLVLLLTTAAASPRHCCCSVTALLLLLLRELNSLKCNSKTWSCGKKATKIAPQHTTVLLACYH
jgi:hypothetical protein